jgi:alpha-ketoglutarate-dependent taurine dioxygenase
MSVAADKLKPLPGVIEPRWSLAAEVLPLESYVIDGTDFAMDDSDLVPDSPLAHRMNQAFDEVGLVWLRNTGLEDLRQMRRFGKLVVENEMRYKGGANPRDSLEANVYEVGAPLTAWLHYHHEMAYISHSTRMLGFLGHKAVAGKGATYVSDNLQATDAILATEFGQKLKELGLCYHRNMTDRDSFKGRAPVGVYNHWQKSMLTDNPDEAVRVAQSRGLEVEWGAERLLKTRYYVSAFEYFPQLLALTFGDGSEMTRDEKQLFVDVYDRFGIQVDWGVGDIVIICNYRFAHGRPGIHLAAGEERELGVLIGDAFERLGHLDDKW